MRGPIPPERYPWWVKLTLLGSRTRRSQWFWIGFEMIVGAVLVVLAIDEAGPGRILFLVAATWAFLVAAASIATIGWIDDHGRWAE